MSKVARLQRVIVICNEDHTGVKASDVCLLLPEDFGYLAVAEKFKAEDSHIEVVGKLREKIWRDIVASIYGFPRERPSKKGL